MASTLPPPQQPTRADWLGWALVAVIGGSAPAAINWAITAAPPTIIAGMRTWLAAVVLIVYTYSTGRRLIAPTSPLGRSVWIYGIGAGFFGYALPFTLFPMAQLHVSSIMAGIVMSFLPVMSVLLAALFANEPLSRRGLAGVLMGTVGVLVLIGPAVFSSADGTLWGIVLLLGAVFGYASMGVVMRRAPEFPARSFAAVMMIAASVMTTPLMILDDFNEVTPQGWWAIIFLGLGPTGFTSILIVTIVRRAGGAFLATSAYASPVISVLLGMVFFAEPLLVNQIIGLLIIFAGVGLTQRGFVRFQRATWPRIVRGAFPARKNASADATATTVEPASPTPPHAGGEPHQ